MQSIRACPQLTPLFSGSSVSVRKEIESLESVVIQERWPDSMRGSPMWTAENRRRYDRSQLRYPSDLTDDEWARVAPLIPPAKSGGKPSERHAHGDRRHA